MSLLLEVGYRILKEFITLTFQVFPYFILGKGPAFSFLLGSAGTCIPTMLMAQKVIGKRWVLIYVIYWFIFAVASGLIFSLCFFIR